MKIKIFTRISSHLIHCCALWTQISKFKFNLQIEINNLIVNGKKCVFIVQIISWMLEWGYLSGLYFSIVGCVGDISQLSMIKTTNNLHSKLLNAAFLIQKSFHSASEFLFIHLVLLKRYVNTLWNLKQLSSSWNEHVNGKTNSKNTREFVIWDGFL